MSPHRGRPELDRIRFWHHLWRPFWVLPSVVAAGSILLGIFLPLLDETLVGILPDFITAGPEGTRQMLGTIAGAMISVTGLVFSITMVVLQLASNQFTPRLLGQFLQSRTVQLTLGVFTGSFLFALTVLRSVRGTDEAADAFVPQISVAVGFSYVLAAVALLVVFIQHVTTSVQVSYVVGDLARRTRYSAARLYEGAQNTATWSPRPGTPHVDVTHVGPDGAVTALDSSGLVRWAGRHDCVVVLHVALGDFIVEGQPIGTVWGTGRCAAPLSTFLEVSPERDLAADFAFGIQQLTDIADRALSPAVNDPTTAVQVVNELYAILRPLVTRPDPSPYLLDSDGAVRGVYPAVTLHSLVQSSLLDIAHYAREAPRVLDRLHDVAAQLADAAIPAHRPALRRLREAFRAQRDAVPEVGSAEG